jgi:hypothetical protein
MQFVQNVRIPRTAHCAQAVARAVARGLGFAVYPGPVVEPVTDSAFARKIK